MDTVISALKAPPRYFHYNVVPKIRPSDEALHTFAVRYLAVYNKYTAVMAWFDPITVLTLAFFGVLIYGYRCAVKAANKHGGGGYSVRLFAVINDEDKVVDPGSMLLYLFDKKPKIEASEETKKKEPDTVENENVNEAQITK